LGAIPKAEGHPGNDPAMGGMGGKEAIKRLIDIDPKVRAIVSSGYSNDPVMSEYKDYGFRGVVPKPYSIEELAQTLHKVMDGE